MKKSLLITLMFTMVAMVVKAQEEPKEVLGFKIKAYADGYWQTKFRNNTKEVLDRAFYTEAETFALGNANIMLEKEFGKAGAVIQLGWGPRADNANGTINGARTPIQQLYAYYKPSDNITLTMGNFGTFVGYEVIDAPANFHYSTSLLFQKGPFFHTGVKADFSISDKFGFMLGVFNETDSKLDIDGRYMNYGGQLSFMPNETSNIYLNMIYGGVSDGDKHKRGQLDLVADKQFSSTYIALNASYQFNSFETAENANWWGIAGYLQQSFSEKFALGTRLEYFDDMDGIAGALQGVDGSVFGITVSSPYSAYGFRIVPEFRVDIASEDVFPTVSGLSSTQTTLGAAVMYSF